VGQVDAWLDSMRARMEGALTAELDEAASLWLAVGWVAVLAVGVTVVTSRGLPSWSLARR
jgi:hypothetical protein